MRGSGHWGDLSTVLQNFGYARSATTVKQCVRRMVAHALGVIDVHERDTIIKRVKGIWRIDRPNSARNLSDARAYKLLIALNIAPLRQQVDFVDAAGLEWMEYVHPTGGSEDARLQHLASLRFLNEDAATCDSPGVQALVLALANGARAFTAVQWAAFGIVGLTMRDAIRFATHNRGDGGRDYKILQPRNVAPTGARGIFLAEQAVARGT